MVKTIGNPVSWVTRAFGRGSSYIGDGVTELGSLDDAEIKVRSLQMSDLKTALRKGMDDFAAFRSDVMFIVLLFPVIGMLLFWLAINRDLVYLLFPLVVGFALLGPLAAIGLYEMSRRREAGLEVSWGDAIGIISSPSFVPMLVLGGYLAAIFIVWMIFAHYLYMITLGPEGPESLGAFVADVFGTGAGWTMMVLGLAIGGVIAAVVLAISVVSFPLLVDRHVGLPRAVVTSLEVARTNPLPIAAWGLIVAVLLGLGVVTFFIGLIVVLPVLGHATWHLYRLAVTSGTEAAAK